MITAEEDKINSELPGLKECDTFPRASMKLIAVLAEAGGGENLHSWDVKEVIHELTRNNWETLSPIFGETASSQGMEIDELLVLLGDLEMIEVLKEDPAGTSFVFRMTETGQQYADSIKTPEFFKAIPPIGKQEGMSPSHTGHFLAKILSIWEREERIALGGTEEERKFSISSAELMERIVEIEEKFANVAVYTGVHQALKSDLKALNGLWINLIKGEEPGEDKISLTGLGRYQADITTMFPYIVRFARNQVRRKYGLVTGE